MARQAGDDGRDSRTDGLLEMLEQRQAALAPDEHAHYHSRKRYLPTEEQDREVRVPLELAHRMPTAHNSTCCPLNSISVDLRHHRGKKDQGSLVIIYPNMQ